MLLSQNKSDRQTSSHTSKQTDRQTSKYTGHPTHLALFIQEVKDSQLALDEVDAGLVVVEVDEGPLDGLAHILLLL